MKVSLGMYAGSMSATLLIQTPTNTQAQFTRGIYDQRSIQNVVQSNLQRLRSLHISSSIFSFDPAFSPVNEVGRISYGD